MHEKTRKCEEELHRKSVAEQEQDSDRRRRADGRTRARITGRIVWVENPGVKSEPKKKKKTFRVRLTEGIDELDVGSGDKVKGGGGPACARPCLEQRSSKGKEKWRVRG